MTKFPLKFEGEIEVDVPEDLVESVRHTVSIEIEKAVEEAKEAILHEVDKRLRTIRKEFRKGDVVRDRYGQIGQIFEVDAPYEGYEGGGWVTTYEIWDTFNGNFSKIWKSARAEDIEAIV